MAIYLDHAATTPVRPEVLQSYLGYLETLGNPAAIHSFGQNSRRLLEEARESIAASLNCNRAEVIFTSGGTESNNLAIKGIFQARNREHQRPLILSSYTEHHAVIDSIEWLAKSQGAEPIWVPVDFEGQIDLNWLSDFVAANHDRIALGSFMWANNEVGTLNPVSNLAAILAEFDIPSHSDSVAAVGQVPMSFSLSGLSALSFTGHKIGAPVGVGALISARSLKVDAQLHGGGHERGLRSGTPNAAAAKALALALEISVANLETHRRHLLDLQQELIAGIRAIAPEAILSGPEQNRLPSNTHFSFPNCSGDSLLFLLDSAGVAVSAGSACTAGVPRPTHVLLAMGRTESQASAALRVTTGYTTTREDIAGFLAALPEALETARKAEVAVR